MAHTFVINKKSYELAYNLKRIGMYEASNPSLMLTFTQNGGMLTIPQMQALIAYGLRYEGGQWINPKTGLEVADTLIEQNGYAPMLNYIVEAVDRDCPFLFKGTDEE